MCSLDGRNRGMAEPPVLGNENRRSFGGEEKGADGLVEACARAARSVVSEESVRSISTVWKNSNTYLDMWCEVD